MQSRPVHRVSAIGSEITAFFHKNKLNILISRASDALIYLLATADCTSLSLSLSLWDLWKKSEEKFPIKRWNSVSRPSVRALLMYRFHLLTQNCRSDIHVSCQRRISMRELTKCIRVLCTIAADFIAHQRLSILFVDQERRIDWIRNDSLISQAEWKHPTVTCLRAANVKKKEECSITISRLIKYNFFHSVYKFNYRCHHSTWLETGDLRLNGFFSFSSLMVLSFKCKCYVIRHAVSLLLSLVPEHARARAFSLNASHSIQARTHTAAYDMLWFLVSFSFGKYKYLDERILADERVHTLVHGVG